MSSNETGPAPSAEEIRGLFAADYTEIVVAADGTIHTIGTDDEVDTATRSLKRERTWYATNIDV